MADLIIRPKMPPTCGTCEFGRTTGDLLKVQCHGVPPTPILVGAGRGPGGQTQMQFELMRPILERKEPGCALWRKRETEPSMDEAARVVTEGRA